MADVFISYSRKDAAFVVRLAPALEARGKTVWVDLKDIPAGAPWREDIAQAIEAADGVVFVVSPDSLGSAHCREEARVARDQGKRIVPVVARPSDPDAAPVEVAELNWRISFTGDAGFDEQVGELVRALELDLDWVRDHTRYQEEANQWQRSRGDRSFLLRGSELVAAESWLARQGGKQPPPTEAQAELVLASRQASTRRLRGLVATLSAGLALAVGLSVFAFVQRQSAIDREQTARARELATSAVSQLGEDPALAVTLAAEAVRTKADPAVVDVLREALATSRERAVRRVEGITDVEFDPTGRFLATAGDRGVQLWRLPAFAAARRLGRDGVSEVTFAQDGRTLVAQGDELARIWPVDGGRALRVARAYPYETAFSADGKIAATVTSNEVRVWDVATNEPRAHLALRGRERPEFSRDGRLIAIRSQFAVRIWDWAGGRPPVTVREPGLGSVLAFSPTERKLVVGSGKSATIWWVGDQTRVTTLRGHTGRIDAVAFSRDGTRVVTGGTDGTARIWGAATGAELAVLRGHRGEVQEDGFTQDVFSASFSPDGTLLATAGNDGTARVWSTTSVPRLAVLRQHAGHISRFELSQDGTRLVTANADGTARIWDIARRREVGVLRAERGHPPARIDSAALGPDGAIATASRKVALWRAGRRTFVFPGSIRVAFSPDGSLLASVNGARVRLTDVASGEPRAEVGLGNREPVDTIAFNRRAEVLATGAQDGKVALWQPDGTRIAVLQGHTLAVYDLAFSPDGLRLASAGSDGTLRFWDPPKPKAVKTLHAGQAVTSVDYNADGRYLAYSLQDGTSRVLNTATGTTVLELPGSHARFLPDGNKIATVEDTAVELWDCDVCADSKELLALADARALRPLTDHERRTYLHQS